MIDNTPPNSPLRTGPLRLVLMALLVVAALLLGRKAWDVNITMSCWNGEWPYLAVCEDILGRTPAEKIERLKERLKGNPGDSEALVDLAVRAYSDEGVEAKLDKAALLAAATKAAPQNGQVLRMQAYEAVPKQEWPLALDALIRLSLFHRDAAASAQLASLVALAGTDKALMTALLDALKKNNAWLDRVVRSMPKAKIPVSTALPLIAQSMESQRMEPALGQYLMVRLKQEGQWTEAYRIWRHLLNRPLAWLFNGDFEAPFVSGGFDWEVAGPNDHRSGARVDLTYRKDHGQVLQVVFSGKAFRPPVLKQDLMLPPGIYRLQGSAQSNDLRSEKGLAWVVTCAQDGRELGRSGAIGATGRSWTTWEATINMPFDCAGFGARIGLQTFAPFEAKTGQYGEILFDALSIKRE